MSNESNIISHSSGLDENNFKKINDTTLSVSVSEGDDNDNDTLTESNSSIQNNETNRRLENQSIQVNNMSGNRINQRNQKDININNSMINSNSNNIDFDSISSVGHSEDIGDNISITSQRNKKNRIRSIDSVSSRSIIQNKNIKQQKGEIPMRSNSQIVNRLKSEIAILQGELVRAEAVDKTILQNKLIEYR